MKFRATIRKEGLPDEIRTIEAPTHFAVYDLIEKEGGFVVSLEEGGGILVLPSWLTITFGSGVRRIEVIRMARNLSAMLGAGLSLSRALSVIERQSGNKYLKSIATGLSDAIKVGSSFHMALAAYPKVFPALFVAMARAGEESGSLTDALTVVSVQLEHSEELIRKIKGAMLYPAIVMTAIVIVGILMLIYVVPTLTVTFSQLGVELPLATQIIVAVSDFMVANVVAVMLGLFVLVVGGIAFIRSAFGGRVVLATALRLPIVNEIVRETYAARASRTLSSLLASGVPVLNALAITKEVVGTNVFADVIGEAEEHVKKGELLSASFAEHTQLYPILMSDMLTVGEETGKVAEMLKQVAEFYEDDVGEQTKNISVIIEPVLVLCIGAAVGVFAVSMIGPIYSLSSAF
ncbi:hypothetical protein A2950_01915 [Candidatus Kaiserbacteria bacterium RIFCSPLOWO2_01_FULL_55_19]|uniref:Type II secretion system protein GspF domain-containing protein n=1 Tax=Candidatus Kaiserbacteria bacterium RIFCSPLOWO2_01_FULL_55_19 TaxID=1798516 RepID=A0A1F6ESR1_9BACT|nr:MAG: hypothetical protein A2950_01915 [Candidatus Kaiserbacteria bacterium RIFCSPLOWO2_01_FULL_55_19]